MEDERNDSMIDLVLGAIILALIAYIAWERRETRKEQSKLINALVSKTPEQYRDLILADKVEPIQPPIDKAPEFVHESEMSDEAFDELIKKEVA